MAPVGDLKLGDLMAIVAGSLKPGAVEARNKKGVFKAEKLEQLAKELRQGNKQILGHCQDHLDQIGRQDQGAERLLALTRGNPLTLCHTFRRQAIWTWDSLRQAKQVSCQIGEESLTDFNLLRIRLRHPNEVFTQSFTKPAESRTGADWE
jgi:hypothetical protein